MPQQYDADVAIIGYGPTAVIAALTLAKNGVRVAAFERDRGIYPRARAVTVNDWTMRIFQDLGIDQAVLRVIEPQRALRWVLYDGTEIMRVEHPPSTLGVKPRFYNIHQPAMEGVLRDCAAAYGELLTVTFDVEVVDMAQDADGVTVTAKDLTTGETTTTRARYAIGADGGSSATRGFIGAAMQGDTLDQLWIIIDCNAKRWWPDRDLLTFWSDRDRPVVDIATSAGHHRWEIPLRPGETEADFPTQAEVWTTSRCISTPSTATTPGWSISGARAGCSWRATPRT